jgi:RNA polymerase primary sigma factor
MIMEPTIEELQELSTSMPQVETNGILTEEQEKNLILKFQEGDLTALSELLEANIRFVITIAKLYENECYFLEMREIIAAGTEGLVLAAEKYPLDADFRFLSYAIFWIRQTIMDRDSDKDEFGC